MSMKKNSFVKFFSLILCLCFALFSFAGCTGGKSGGGDDESGEPSLLSGVKVLTRPENYDFDKALGEYSTNYYNILSKNVLLGLYKLYGSANLSGNSKNEILGENENQKTSYNGLENRAYMFDSTRYTITNVSSTESSGQLVEQVVTLDTSAKWNWSIKFDAANSKPYFFNSEKYVDDDGILSQTNGNLVTITFDYSKLIYWKDIGWTNVFSENNLKDYFSSYYSDEYEPLEDPLEVDYFYSPFYPKEGESSFNNYFQDALEYAIYMISLGYTVDDDADYFDFEIGYDNATGLVSGMTVGGWETGKISVSDQTNGALKRAKEKYKAQTNFVGLKDKNIEEIAKFVKKVVIGDNALAKNVVNTGSVTINRDYDKVVSNIVEYACAQAPIGKDKDGNKITLGKNFLTSKITDYAGDYFGISLGENEDGEYDDSNLFENIDAAEYQSIVFFPQAEDVGKKLTDIWLIFEYYDLEAGSTKVIDKENGITINIGVRYFNSQSNEVVKLVEKQIKVGYGKNGETEDGPLTELMFSNNDEPGVDAAFSQTITVNTEFDNNVGDGVINALENGEGDNDLKKSIAISGLSNAKDYFKLNDSSSYGQYGTLNEEAFVGVCDFVEMYFDIVKDKDSTNKSYAFKFAATIIFEDVD